MDHGAPRASIPKFSDADLSKAIIEIQEELFQYGITGVHEAGIDYQHISLFRNMVKNGSLKLDVYAMLRMSKENLNFAKKYGQFRYKNLSIQSFKVWADGALGSRGACLLKHYADQKGWGGFLLSSKAHFDSIAAKLINTDFQMCTHAIGDSANRTILNVYAKYLKGKNDKRWRIEHAQIVHPDDFQYFGKYSIIPSVQPTHGTSDMYWAGDRLGEERMKGAYAYKQLLEQNNWLPLGTDFPVEEINPFKTFLAAVVRKDAKGYPAEGFQMENALTREETIRGMTIWAAKAGFLEKVIEEDAYMKALKKEYEFFKNKYQLESRERYHKEGNKCVRNTNTDQKIIL